MRTGALTVGVLLLCATAGWAAEKAAPKGAAKTVEKGAAKTVEKPPEPTVEKSAEKSVEKTLDKGAPAGAQKEAEKASETQTPSVKVTRGAGGEKVYRITEGIVIEGKIQKPEAFYVLQRSTINYDWETLKQDFLPRVLDSVKHSPF